MCRNKKIEACVCRTYVKKEEKIIRTSSPKHTAYIENVLILVIIRSLWMIKQRILQTETISREHALSFSVIRQDIKRESARGPPGKFFFSILLF